ncbi:TauD/TfdA family dioxygenase [Streptomyces beigongshangae]|uniref:TauD/TfdA family dioxygenase n=1 Tax=Streptomyces beigongshangae TaxID=2841597 RepID=UPI001C866600|nr:TauD/TfdA family dioxygenase [Streptomyces sp. REN17]
MTDSAAAALADFSSTRQPEELMTEQAQQAALRRARGEIPELHRLLDEAVTALRTSLAVVVENFPPDATALAVAATALGRVDPSCNGPVPDTLVHDVVDSEARPYRDPDPFHTDSPLQAEPHAYLGLLCVRPSPAGDGRTVLVSAADVAAEIADDGRLRALQAPRYPFAVPREPGEPGEPGGDGSSVTTHPILTVSGEDVTVRYCPVRVTAGVRSAGHALDAEHVDALGAFERALEAPRLPTVFLLRAGELLLLDNRRLLHGRTDVGPSGVGRHLMRVKVRTRTADA